MPEGTWLLIASAQWSFTWGVPEVEVVRLGISCTVTGTPDGPLTVAGPQLVMGDMTGSSTASLVVSESNLIFSCDTSDGVQYPSMTLSIQRVSS